MFQPEQASGGGLLENLGINLKVLLTQVVIFSITFLVLSRTLFGKALGFMKKREEEVQSSQEAIARDQAEVARLTKEYEAHLAQVEKAAYERTQEILKEALAQAGASVAKAQAEAKVEVERAIAEISREKNESLARLRAEVVRLTKDVAEKVLETPVDPATASAAVQKMAGERS
jgi:F0F1-type ATP synthase membrane subunit b/b'